MSQRTIEEVREKLQDDLDAIENLADRRKLFYVLTEKQRDKLCYIESLLAFIDDTEDK